MRSHSIQNLFALFGLGRPGLVFPDFARVLHLRIAGEPGSGKSFLAALICLQDILRGIPTMILDRNGTLIRALIALILGRPDREREEILSRFVYVDLKSALVHGLPFFSYEEGLRAYDNADTLIEAIWRMTPAEYEVQATTLRQYGMTACMALYEAGRLTGIPFQVIETIPFLEDQNFRSRILHVIKNTQPDVARFYLSQYNQWPFRAQNEDSFSFKTKIYPFLYNDTLRAIVGANRITLSFAELEAKRLIVVVDLSGLSAQAVFLIGSLLINRFARYLFSHFNRELPISLVADEAASLLEYSGMARDFEDFQSRARAFKLWLLVVHQTMHQLDPKLRQAMWSLGSQYIMRLLNIEDAQEAVSNLLDFAPEKAKIPEGAEKPTGMTPLEQTRFDANALQKAKNREGIYRRPVLKRNWRLQTNEVVWQTTWEKVPYIHLGDVSESMIEEVKQRSLQTFARPKAQVLREIESRMEKAMALPIADRKQRRREKA